MPPTADQGFFELTFAPNLELVSTVRRFVSDFYERLLGESDVTARVALATHEMLENAVKGASDGQTRLRIDLRRDGADHRVTVRTWNRPAAADRERLMRMIDTLKSVEPLPYYLEVMRKTSKEPTGSGLGLARIRAEAEMNLDYVIEGDLICVSAETRVPIASI